MSLFDNFSRFLETRLEEFLRSHPHLELQAILEQLREQEQEAVSLIAEKQAQKKRLETEILAVAEEIQRWHQRVAKAKAANRLDLAQKAQEREAALLRQGNQLWGQMEGAKQQITQTQTLLRQIQQRKQEVQTKARTAQAQAKDYNSGWETRGWNQGVNYQSYGTSADSLEAEFKRWELDDELERLKKNL